MSERKTRDRKRGVKGGGGKGKLGTEKGESKGGGEGKLGTEKGESKGGGKEN